MKKEELTVGQYVTYAPRFGNREHGRVKELHPERDAAWVVYKCGGNWEHYQHYTGALTDCEYLLNGWQ
jgi:hypothetical protein